MAHTETLYCRGLKIRCCTKPVSWYTVFGKACISSSERRMGLYSTIFIPNVKRYIKTYRYVKLPTTFFVIYMINGYINGPERKQISSSTISILPEVGARARMLKFVFKNFHFYHSQSIQPLFYMSIVASHLPSGHLRYNETHPPASSHAAYRGRCEAPMSHQQPLNGFH
jgi:hypothetical protein